MKNSALLRVLTRNLVCAVVAALFAATAFGGSAGCSSTPADAESSPTAPSANEAGAAPVTTTPGSSTSSSPAGSPTSSSAPDSAAPPSQIACGSGKPGAKGDSTITLTHDGQDRHAKVHVPQSYDPAKGMSVILNVHGLTGTPDQQAWLTKMSPAADAHGFIVVYPEGLGNSWNADYCCNPSAQNHVDDVGFIRALIAKVKNDFCVDEKRVFVTGMSNGGHFSYISACKLADVVAAVAPVSGVLTTSESGCQPARPVPIMHFHGNADGVVNYNGMGPGFPSAPGSISAFKKKYGCDGDSGHQTFQHGDATCVSYSGCSADLTLCTIDGGGHTWPNGNDIGILGKVSHDIDATEQMIAFFQSHPMP